MPKIILHSPTGALFTVDAQIGASVMETAVKHGVPGIVAECGGALSCATCHVYIADSFIDLTGQADDFEDEMLDDTASVRKPNSRLSCQIRMTAALDGLEAEIAPEQ
ncbi:2Fe-2S iron-sulfur cluster-binding protein [Cryobacterium sp. PH29-G1]|uniref:2Fe-2S iron-sulfur cluster-binding protein n=1 Tax=Cryobacterium sp. PH29-G1 TaxID=3046211 RepID=UPI0024BB8B92|nr:2Fe-2S iron-sulfur cluster-binding protein [Cryobacterium sp. PH29-G1]MDJ0349580.1 2Fe-2S iron-sulfur cluster-binding protein [Cryobacterium sp. PH29-G1]